MRACCEWRSRACWQLAVQIVSNFSEVCPYNSVEGRERRVEVGIWVYGCAILLQLEVRACVLGMKALVSTSVANINNNSKATQLNRAQLAQVSAGSPMHSHYDQGYDQHRLRISQRASARMEACLCNWEYHAHLRYRSLFLNSELKVAMCTCVHHSLTAWVTLGQ